MSGAAELAPGPGALDLLLSDPRAATVAVVLGVALIAAGVALRRVAASARAARPTSSSTSEAP